VIVDAVALGQMTRWAMESLAAAPLPIVIRVTATQRAQYPLPAEWLTVTDADSPEQLRQSVGTFFELHKAKSQLSRLHDAPAPVAQPVRVAPMESYRYRDA